MSKDAGATLSDAHIAHIAYTTSSMIAKEAYDREMKRYAPRVNAGGGIESFYICQNRDAWGDKDRRENGPGEKSDITGTRRFLRNLHWVCMFGGALPAWLVWNDRMMMVAGAIVVSSAWVSFTSEFVQKELVTGVDTSHSLNGAITYLVYITLGVSLFMAISYESPRLIMYLKGPTRRRNRIRFRALIENVLKHDPLAYTYDYDYDSDRDPDRCFLWFMDVEYVKEKISDMSAQGLCGNSGRVFGDKADKIEKELKTLNDLLDEGAKKDGKINKDKVLTSGRVKKPDAKDTESLMPSNFFQLPINGVCDAKYYMDVFIEAREILNARGCCCSRKKKQRGLMFGTASQKYDSKVV